MFWIVFVVLVSVVIHGAHGFVRAVDVIREGGEGRAPATAADERGGATTAGGQAPGGRARERGALPCLCPWTPPPRTTGKARRLWPRPPTSATGAGARALATAADGRGGRAAEAGGRRVDEYGSGREGRRCHPVQEEGGEGEVRKRGKGQAALLYP